MRGLLLVSPGQPGRDNSALGSPGTVEKERRKAKGCGFAAVPPAAVAQG